MKRIYQYIIIIVLLSSCQKKEQELTVAHYGVLREIMMELKLNARIDLEGLSQSPNLYGLGALEGLSGELLILNGKVYKTTLNDSGQLVTDNSMNGGAALLVSSKVKAWHEIRIDTDIKSLSELETVIKPLAKQQGIDTDRPFPFMLTGNFNHISAHVIYAPGASEQSHDAYKQSGVFTELKELEAEILGFYSEQHQGVFTHHGSFIHAHVLDGQNAAHVDALAMKAGITLKLPKSW